MFFKKIVTLCVKFISESGKIISLEIQYRNLDRLSLVTHEENYNGTGKIFATVRVKGTRTIFQKPVKELYEKSINFFSKEDAAFLAILYICETREEFSSIKYFPRKKQRITKNVVFLGMIFVSCLVVSNITGFKIVEFHLFGLKLLDLNFPAALLFFPLTYFFDDVATEVYGFSVSRLIIWGGLIASIIIAMGMKMTIELPPSHIWHWQKEYALIFHSSMRIFFASICGYFSGEFLNALIISKLKIRMHGKHLWLRIVLSSSAGIAIDSIIFCLFSFYGIIPSQFIFNMVIFQYIFKINYVVLALPLTYLITGYLKKTDEVDYYDYKTKLNPFSLEL